MRPQIRRINLAEQRVFVDSSFRANKKRIEQDEKELEELMKKPEKVEEEVEEKEEEPKKELNAEEETFKKRYGDLRRHLSQKEKEWEEKFEQLKNQPKGIAPPKTDEDIEAWVKKYPDVAGIVETIAKKKAQELFDKTDQRFKELDRLQYETQRKSAEQTIKEAHPDFEELKESNDFHDWAEEQPKWVQDALYENEDDPRSVIRVIDLYKVDKGLTLKQKQETHKEAAKAIKSTSSTKIDAEESSKKIRESQVAKMSDKEYEAAEASILEAMRTGNFIYDVSGGAR